jgi:hypothetical protein
VIEKRNTTPEKDGRMAKPPQSEFNLTLRDNLMDQVYFYFILFLNPMYQDVFK